MEGCITLPSCERQVLNFLGAKINYGGRVTDDKDKLFLVCTMYELGISEAENWERYGIMGGKYDLTCWY